jgi:hypothetical protein
LFFCFAHFAAWNFELDCVVAKFFWRTVDRLFGDIIDVNLE